MCGIFGLYQVNDKPLDINIVKQATNTIRHRGPDDEGYLLVNTSQRQVIPCSGEDTNPELRLKSIDEFYDRSFNMAFGFRRLSILDLSSSGHQPMVSYDGRHWIVFNGEIYNYIELRDELKTHGYIFCTDSDTEVVLASYAHWGEDCLNRFNGMWAFAIVDVKENQLFCARDRFGIKPFYYFWDGQIFAFASEIKALLALPFIKPRPNNVLIYDYLAFGLMDHTDETLFTRIKQIPPASALTLSSTSFKVNRYWRLNPDHKIELPDDDSYSNSFYQLFEEAIRLHLRSDVTIGTCLSGGLDSSSIVCVANKLLFSEHVLKPDLVGSQQKTFSSCFEDPRFDERHFIEMVTLATNAEANYTFPSPAKLHEDLPRLIWHQDEPFGSISIFAQWSVMQLATQHGVRVLLDGQGGDELLGGYHYYFDYLWGSLASRGRWSELQKELLAHQALYHSKPMWGFLKALQKNVVPGSSRYGKNFSRRSKYPVGLRQEFASNFHHRRYNVNNYSSDLFWNALHESLTHSVLPRLLHYEDRNSMAHSIEARVPFLDYRLVEFVFALPPNQKIKRALTKTVLRNALKGVLPESVRMRTSKMGFETPEKVWLSNDLKDWAASVLGSTSIRQRGYVDIGQIHQAYKEHLAGKRDLSHTIWRWINLELWFQQVIDVN